MWAKSCCTKASVAASGDGGATADQSSGCTLAAAGGGGAAAKQPHTRAARMAPAGRADISLQLYVMFIFFNVLKAANPTPSMPPRRQLTGLHAKMSALSMRAPPGLRT